MNATLLLNVRHPIATEASWKWWYGVSLRPSPEVRHDYKYRLALVVNGNCVMRYDNELGKGDHKHMGEEETFYPFTTPEALLDDFWRDIDNWRR